MKRMFAVFVLWLAATTAWAQLGSIKVEITVERRRFLAGEGVGAAVRITNLSGQSLRLGEEPGWIQFYVEGIDNSIVPKLGDPSLEGAFLLESSKSAIKRVNLAPYFNLQKPGRYRATARIKIPQWSAEASSEPVGFDVVRGTTLQTFEFGVPASSDSGALPEIRKYILQEAKDDKGLMLYLRLTDATESVAIKVFPIARLMSFNKPEGQLDRFSNLHVLHQIGQRSFSYCTVNPDGQILARQIHDYHGDSRPRLRMAEGGRVVVKGGMRRLAETDLPPSLDSNLRIIERTEEKEGAKPASP